MEKKPWKEVKLEPDMMGGEHLPITACTQRTAIEINDRKRIALSLPDLDLDTDNLSCVRYVGCDWLSMRS